MRKENLLDIYGKAGDLWRIFGFGMSWLDKETYEKNNEGTGIVFKIWDAVIMMDWLRECDNSKKVWVLKRKVDISWKEKRDEIEDEWKRKSVEGVDGMC